MALCECGCGQEVKPLRRFISGHNYPMRNPETALKHNLAITKGPEHREAYRRQWYKENRTIKLAQSKQLKLNYKIQVLTHYGNGKCICLWCGYDQLAALTLDHINNDGYKESRSGHELYRWLMKQNYPAGYQTLCMNCQYLKREQYAASKVI
jgi:hypothetical protein